MKNVPDFKFEKDIMYSQNQFQPGDFVFFTEEETIARVKFIAVDKIAIVYTKSSSSYFSESYVKESVLLPIQLNPTILQEFGFDAFHQVFIKKGVIIKKDRSIFLFEGINISFVHELQQIWFLHTGENLQLQKQL